MWKDDEYKKLFDRAVASINEFWSEELTEKLHTKHPAKLTKLVVIEKNIEDYWGKDMPKFRQALIDFYKTYKEVTQ